MSNTQNSFQLNLAGESTFLNSLFDTNLGLETVSVPYTATFTDVDNINVSSQAMRYATIGSLKIVYGLLICECTQANQALGSHRVSLPPGFFTMYYTCCLTMGQSTAYQLTAHTIDQGDFESVQIAYSQGQAPSGNTFFTTNVLIIGF